MLATKSAAVTLGAKRGAEKVGHLSHFPPIADKVLQFIRQRVPSTEPRCRGDHLSPSERELLLQVVEGHSTKRIAWHLGVNEITAKINLKSVLRKIRVNNRTQAAIWALDNLPELDPTPRGSV
jgi:DNA-binding CsgD family transcriptional regulator